MQFNLHAMSLCATKYSLLNSKQCSVNDKKNKKTLQAVRSPRSYTISILFKFKLWIRSCPKKLFDEQFALIKNIKLLQVVQ